MKTTQLLKNLDTQIAEFIDGLEQYNHIRPGERQRSKRDYDFLRDFFMRFLTDRNIRAEEVQSKHYEKIKNLANAQFPVPTLWNLCMDGRVKSVVINGMTAGVGGTIRVPGGILREFIRDETGNCTLRRKSNFASLLVNALSWEHVDTISEVFDSHVGCAARNVEEQARGRNLTDMGLLSDVLHKKEMLQALNVFITTLYGNKKHVIGIQTSFDPHCGYLYMGLETDGALDIAKERAQEIAKKDGKKHRWEYTGEVLRSLIHAEKIIFTEELVKLPEIKRVFENNVFVLNWEKDYIKTAETFWNNISNMKESLTPILQKKLISIYPHLKKKDLLSSREVEERTMILLTNAYSGFLNNYYGTYPYGVHREECIKVSLGGFPPYDISAFVVLSSDEKNLVSNIELAAALVRANRAQERVEDRSGNFQDPEEFAQAPVPLIIQEILDDELDQNEWDRVCSIMWDDMPHDWDSLTDREFFSYLETKGDIHLRVGIAMNNLRQKMAILFDPDQILSGRLVSHHKVALPVIVDKNRINYFIVPFIKHGFSQ